jgi:cell division septation protein DedD
MRGTFDDEEFEPVQYRRDTELTLGSGTLLAIFFGLVLLCGLFFGLGYAVGHHGAPQPAAAGLGTAASAQTSTPAVSVRPKPPAAPQTSAGYLPPAANGQGPTAVLDANSQGPAVASGQPQVRPALPAAGNGAQAATGPGAPAASSPAVPLMVQIAAVSNPQDAEVLVNALRKRGYSVTVRREFTDNLIHVRIGPFSSRGEANQWRQKLLNDGYNAIVEP